MKRRAFLALSASVYVFGAAQIARAQDDKKFKPEELDQMLAPIALYPDGLLSQILMASGYPLEIVEAARWSKANPTLKGDAAVQAVKDKDWDTSVKSLVAFPDVLANLNEHLDWTQKMGDAMIGQEGDVAEFDPAPARQGFRRRQPAEHAAADRDDPGLGRQHPVHHPADQPGGHLRPVLQPELGLRGMVLSGLSAGLLPVRRGTRPRLPVGRGLRRGGRDIRRLELGRTRQLLRQRERQPRGQHRQPLQPQQHQYRRPMEARRRSPQGRRLSRQCHPREVQPGCASGRRPARGVPRPAWPNNPGAGNHPQIGNRPGAGNHPQLANRPGAGGGGVQRSERGAAPEHQPRQRAAAERDRRRQSRPADQPSGPARPSAGQPRAIASQLPAAAVAAGGGGGGGGEAAVAAAVGMAAAAMGGGRR